MKRLTGLSLVMGGLALGAVSARAQPFIFPLQQQNHPQQPAQGQPMVSSPPVAPPQAGPSLPSTTDTADAPTVNPQEETASQPTSR